MLFVVTTFPILTFVIMDDIWIDTLLNKVLEMKFIFINGCQ